MDLRSSGNGSSQVSPYFVTGGTCAHEQLVSLNGFAHACFVAPLSDRRKENWKWMEQAQGLFEGG